MIHRHELAGLVRRADPDRFFCTLFAAASAWPALLTLYAFNHELARAREAAHEPGLAMIRLQWWREVVEGADRRHEIATPLARLIADGVLHVPDLLAMLDARDQELDPPATRAAFVARLLQGPGSLAVAAGRVLGAGEATRQRLRRLGAGYGLAGLLRNAASGVQTAIDLWPQDLPAVGGAEALAAEGRALLGAAAPIDPAAIAAGLPAVLARRDLHQPTSVPRPRDIADRLTVTLAAFAGKA